MNTNKILFPTDFSHCGDAALEMATSLAVEHQAMLLIVHVEEPAAAYGGGELYLPELDHQDLLPRLHDIVPADPRVMYDHRLISGTAATAIVRLAEAEDVEMIVMGTHGRTGLTRMIMGSVAEDVVRHASCPVMTVRQDSEVVPMLAH